MPQTTDAVYPRVAHYNASAGEQGPFAIPFPFASAGDIKLYLDGEETVAFTVTQVTEYGTTDNSVSLVTPLLVDKLVTVASSVQRFPLDEDIISAEAVKLELDRIYAAQQETDYRLSRTPVFAMGTSTTNYDFLEDPVAGRLVVFGEDGIENGPQVTGLNVVVQAGVAFAQLLLDSTMSYTAGDGLTVMAVNEEITTAEGLRFRVAPSAAVNHHHITAGGLKLYEAGFQFSTRARLVEHVTRGNTLHEGRLYTGGGEFYRAKAGDVSIADLPGMTRAGGAALEALSPLVPAADRLAYFNGATGAALATLTSFARTLLDDADATAGRATLGLGTAATSATQTSASDTTAAALLRVGAFGMGITATAGLMPTDSLDATDTPSGLWRVAAASTLGTWPAAAANGTVLLMRYNASTFVQIYSPSTSDAIYFRRYAGSFGAWQTLLDSGDLGVTVQAYDADLAAIAALAHTAGGFMADNGSAWVRQAILGTVTQSGGTPTGALMESGSNANGSYARFANGWQICAHNLTSNASAAVAWTFPAAFVSAPDFAHVSPTVANSRFGTCGNFATTAMDFWVWTDAGVQAAVASRLVAIGKWF